MSDAELTWIEDNAREDKLVPLESAVAAHVHPGMSVFLPSDARAALRALIRQFWKQQPQLTLITLRVGGSHCVDLLAAGLVKRVIGSSFGAQFPSFRPSKIMQRVFNEGKVEIECWSLMALVQRLMAAGLGIPFMPTRSMVGSDLVREVRGATTLTSPFSGEETLLVEALYPDVTFLHALACDAQGNALVPPPSEDDLWSTRAARKGCIVLAENIVSTDFVRQHSHLVRVPPYRVLAVCHTPFAAHPDGYDTGLELGLPVSSYLRDIPHYQAYYEATLKPETFEAWLEQWVMGIADQPAYLQALGAERLAALQPQAGQAQDWRRAYSRIPSEAEVSAEAPQPATAMEMMLAAASRTVAEVAREHGLRHCLAGAGSTELAASLALYELRRLGYNFALVNGVGRFGYEPVPVAQHKQLTATMLSGTVDIYGTVVGGSESRCLSLVGSGEIDIYGNTNSTRTHGHFLVGSGGVNDAITGAACSIVMMRQEARRMVPRVEFVTCPGVKVTHLVTDQGIYRKNARGEFELWRFYAPEGTSPSAEEAVARAQESCGWRISAAPDIAAVPGPTLLERRLMRWLDPAGKVTGRAAK